MSIQPKQTEYDNHKFRSRLEARYAVFFNELGVKFRYEPETYRFPNGTQYLPDFLVYSSGQSPYFLEVKPFDPTPLEIEKAAQLAYYTNQQVFVVIGLPGEKPFISFDSAHPSDKLIEQCLEICQLEEQDAYSALYDIENDLHHYDWREWQSRIDSQKDWFTSNIKWAYTNIYRMFSLCSEGYLSIGWVSPCETTGWCEICDNGGDFESYRLKSAYRSAKQARFEFGETPRSFND